ncbi:branched-chain amino acid transaminase [Rubrobacter taiwanensis]|jgi:branched-chain amino acid aminotransferase|uniref:Branched-chain-amino-acid aminotransferase n=1 Tax=Rubrobacter taiwanensis TaxID=185139 RepID=A0A4R1BSA6_9ACTN|nr:branched-chain amino acid transaminase [Rubrobacter taiwanensis]TCJ20674.1 branched-chain amino acid transaminase [Rubrobacter taiwanensis]
MSRKAFAVSDGDWSYFDGEFVRLGEVRLSPAANALNYGTGVFEGIRAYWNPERQELRVLKLREHYERFANSCKLMRIDPGLSVDDLCEVTLEILRRNAPRVDTYIRPLAFKSAESIGVKLSGLKSSLSIFTVPMGNYVELTGLRCCVASWRRIPDNAIPARCKLTGAYINTALAVDDAQKAGFDDAIFLTQEGTVSEASAANIFIVRRGEVVTPPLTADILEGITRDAVMELLEREWGIEVVERDIDRTELYAADEVFLTGTGYQIAPVVEIDHRPVGSGEMGPITGRLQEAYFRAARGDNPDYEHWTVPVETAHRERAAAS